MSIVPFGGGGVYKRFYMVQAICLPDLDLRWQMANLGETERQVL
jgi:hypothetical protein